MKPFLLLALLLLFASAATAQKALRVGQKAPNFVANNQNGTSIDLGKTLKKGPVVVLFYRGYWCSYCSVELKNLQDSLQLITAKGATVIAISPEAGEGVGKTVEKAGATFHVISDKGLAITKSYGLLQTVTPEMDAVHKQYNIDVVGNNAENGNFLPYPAAYIIQQNGQVSYAYINTATYADPKVAQRVSVAELIANLPK